MHLVRCRQTSRWKGGTWCSTEGSLRSQTPSAYQDTYVYMKGGGEEEGRGGRGGGGGGEEVEGEGCSAQVTDIRIWLKTHA